MNTNKKHNLGIARMKRDSWILCYIVASEKNSNFTLLKNCLLNGPQLFAKNAKVLARFTFRENLFSERFSKNINEAWLQIHKQCWREQKQSKLDL